MGRGAFSGGDSVFGYTLYNWDGGVAMPNTQSGSSMGDSSGAPRYDTRSTTRGRGEYGGNSSTRGGRGGFPLGPSLPSSGADINLGSGRGRGHTTLGHGPGEGDAQGGQATSFAPFSPPTPTNFGCGRGAAPPDDNLTIGDALPGTRGRGFTNGRGGRGGRGRARAAVDVGGVEVVAVEERADLREKLRWNGMVAA